MEKGVVLILITVAGIATIGMFEVTISGNAGYQGDITYYSDNPYTITGFRSIDYENCRHRCLTGGEVGFERTRHSQRQCLNKCAILFKNAKILTT